MVDTRPLLKVGGGKLGWEVPSSIINFLILGNVGPGKSVIAKLLVIDVFITAHRKKEHYQCLSFLKSNRKTG